MNSSESEYYSSDTGESSETLYSSTDDEGSSDGAIQSWDVGQGRGSSKQDSTGSEGSEQISESSLESESEAEEEEEEEDWREPQGGRAQEGARLKEKESNRREEEEEKVDFIEHWTWDKFKAREAKSEVYVDFQWNDFIPHPTTLEYQIRVKACPEKVREESCATMLRLHRTIACWATNVYVCNTVEAEPASKIKNILTNIELFLGRSQLGSQEHSALCAVSGASEVSWTCHGDYIRWIEGREQDSQRKAVRVECVCGRIATVDEDLLRIIIASILRLQSIGGGLDSIDNWDILSSFISHIQCSQTGLMSALS